MTILPFHLLPSRVVSYYQCDACPNEWADECECVRTAFCPSCDEAVEPYSSVEIDRHDLVTKEV